MKWHPILIHGLGRYGSFTITHLQPIYLKKSTWANQACAIRDVCVVNSVKFLDISYSLLVSYVFEKLTFYYHSHEISVIVYSFLFQGLEIVDTRHSGIVMVIIRWLSGSYSPYDWHLSYVLRWKKIHIKNIINLPSILWTEEITHDWHWTVKNPCTWTVFNCCLFPIDTLIYTCLFSCPKFICNMAINIAPPYPHPLFACLQFCKLLGLMWISSCIPACCIFRR